MKTLQRNVNKSYSVQLYFDFFNSYIEQPEKTQFKLTQQKQIPNSNKKLVLGNGLLSIIDPKRPPLTTVQIN